MPASAYACAREDIYRWVADGREYLYFVRMECLHVFWDGMQATT